MIRYMRGNLFDSEAEALVNTVNCVGVMGKGIAYQFRRAFPRMYKDYRARCRREEIRPGEVTSFRENGRIIVNFPSKRHWRNRSRIEDIETGLVALRAFIECEQIEHIAIPPLGCGNGGLEWPTVRLAIEAALARLRDVRLDVYEPHGDFASKVAAAPALSLGHVVLASLRVRLQTDKATALQKAAYFFSSLSSSRYFRFKPHKYGPYCPTLPGLMRDIRDYLDYHHMTIDELIRDFEQRSMAGRDLTRLHRDLPAIDAAAALCNRLGIHIEAAATAHAVLEQDDDELSCDDVIERFLDWSPEKRARFDAGDVHHALELLEKEELAERTLLGWRKRSPSRPIFPFRQASPAPA